MGLKGQGMSSGAVIRTALADGEQPFEPGRTRLVLRAGFDGGGPGHSEEWNLRLGPETDGKWDVLWVRTDWDEQAAPVAWLPRGALRGRELALALLSGWFEALRDHEDAEAPPFEEVQRAKSALLTARDLSRLSKRVWPEDS